MNNCPGHREPVHLKALKLNTTLNYQKTQFLGLQHNYKKLGVYTFAITYEMLINTHACGDTCMLAWGLLSVS